MTTHDQTPLILGPNVSRRTPRHLTSGGVAKGGVAKGQNLVQPCKIVFLIVS